MKQGNLIKILTATLLIATTALATFDARPCPIKLQGARRSANGMHRELWRADLQDGVSDLHEILRDEIVSRMRS
jgi:hypothetical protein